MIARERALLARTLLLEIVVDALCDAEVVDVDAVRSRTQTLAREWPEGVDPEQLLDTQRGVAARLEHSVSRARRQRENARAMRNRAVAMRRDGGTHAAPSSSPLDDAHEALALLQLLDRQLYDHHDGASPS